MIHPTHDIYEEQDTGVLKCRACGANNTESDIDLIFSCPKASDFSPFIEFVGQQRPNEDVEEEAILALIEELHAWQDTKRMSSKAYMSAFMFFVSEIRVLEQKGHYTEPDFRLLLERALHELIKAKLEIDAILKEADEKDKEQ